MVLAFLSGLAAIALVTLGAAPVEAEVTDSHHRLIPVVQRSALPDSSPQTVSLLSSSFTITIPRQLKQRYLAITEVEFMGEDGELLGPSNLSAVTGSWSSLELPGVDVLRQITDSVPDASAIPLSPLGETEISLRATAQQDLGLEPGSAIYAEIEGTSGSEEFTVRSELGLATAADA